MLTIGEYDLKNIFLPDIFSPIPDFHNLNDILEDTPSEAPTKRPIKFVLTKEEPASSSFLQKKLSPPNKFGSNSINENGSAGGRWTKEEQKKFAEAILKYGNDWKKIQEHVSSRNITQIRSHAQKFLMKLKESQFLKNKGLDLNASWTKVINFMINNLTYDELKNVLFSVEQTSHKRYERKFIKCFKKFGKNFNKENKGCNTPSTKSLDENENSSFSNDNSDINDEFPSDISFGGYRNSLLNLKEENFYDCNQKSRFLKKEEEKSMFEKFIKCFNSNCEEIALNTSFEEENDVEYISYNPLNNEPIVKFNNPLDIL